MWEQARVCAAQPIIRTVSQIQRLGRLELLLISEKGNTAGAQVPGELSGGGSLS